jgi:hypothetical protein
MRVDGMKSISLYESIKSNDLRLQEIWYDILIIWSSIKR